ncbi:MAG TPA: serpin family protein [Anaerolineae bacterium]|nr:serpin family protein [Anaerolineae bacterium]HQH37455.1 serpin family protein [Anaerolineae bacterium]
MFDHFKYARRFASIAIVAGVLLAACGPLTPSAVTSPPEMPAATSLSPLPQASSGGAHLSSVRSELPRETAPQVSAEARQALAAGNRALALDLYRVLRAQGGNLFYSPYSISTALAMAYAGAAGETQRQMAAALHFTLPPEALHPAFNALDLDLTAAEATDAFRLNIANALWAQAGYEFQPRYLDTLAVNYGAGLRLADFTQDALREEARQAINAWVSEQTEKKIEELLQPGDLKPDARLVLLNAIYFKADWKVPFSGDQQSHFMRLDGSSITVPAMTRRAETPYLAGAGFTAFALDYKGDRVRMLVLVPDAGTFEAFEETLDAARIAAIMAELEPTDLQLTMPKFEFKARFALQNALANLGMTAAFQPGVADFSGMDGTHDLFIQSIIHEAYVAVDEEGTEAAAATGVVAGIVSMPLNTITVDRPFIFLIHDVESDTLLFVGRVLDPTA